MHSISEANILTFQEFVDQMSPMFSSIKMKILVNSTSEKANIGFQDVIPKPHSNRRASAVDIDVLRPLCLWQRLCDCFYLVFHLERSRISG
ncbi:hypothetical protein AVEN_74892-1 [Araneus ventricosus]|uniref:Uncharacterized protein n=1 Tax=Araneus ventricosus TaxID=182803 RepID=A0A4Y2N6X9_ARAVE|nr:hypothetical protein AVEN_74892-1 [Araneus ventricosus]